ncbi:hypothetical protein C8A01DRAFT_13046 [Parachaetomium inaequale]|uniref:Uncharacterized protein n=1 Tax=Parachaetomium inaequale TaxID=2588326 RepID=A0AAN6SV77_9PEZI|nr:hypothetical protein C8A01DRAFT_13046 [Parachaetomium inaequale]
MDTSLAYFTQNETNQAGDNQLEGDNPSGPNPAQSDREDSRPEPCLQGESAATPITPPPCSPAAFSAAVRRPSVNLASLTSPETDSVPKQDAAPCERDSTSDSDCEAHGPEPCLQGASAEAAIPLPPCAGANPAALTRPALTSPENPEHNTDETPNNGNVVVESDSDAGSDTASPGPSRDIPRAAAPPARRSETATSSTVAAGHRDLHPAQMPPRRCPRALENFRAMQALFAPRPPPANTVTVNAPNPPQTSARTRGGNQASQHPRAPQAQQATNAANAAVHRARIPIIDMEGVPHIMGGLVEQSVGLKNPLFAKQVQGNPSDPYNSVQVGRHGYFHFPPPDMGGINREFERELDESRPVFEPLDADLVDSLVDGYAAQTKMVDEVMEEHQAEFDPVNESFLANKNELADLNYDRERAITSAYALKDSMTPSERARLLAQIAAAEAPLLKQQEAVRQELKEIVLRGRAKIARTLRQDLRAPDTIDEQRTRARQRKEVEEQDTELGIAGAMLGLRGSLKEQNHSTHTAILRYTQLVVDEGQRAFDQQNSWNKPVGPAPSRPTSNVDAVIAAVPLWFTILDARGTIELRSATPLDRFKELLRVMGTSSNTAREEQWADEFRPNRNSWNKHYHKPNDAWPNAIQRSGGGWWACRSGPDASPAELNCKLCHPRDLVSPESDPAPSATVRYQHILDEIETAQAEANKRDQLVLKYQLQQERDDIDRYWQRREWNRSGGGVDIREVLHGRDVNELNYRPSLGRSQSWQPGAATQSSELHGRQVISQTSAPQTGASQNPQLLGGSQVHELLSGRRISNDGPSPQTAGLFSPPRRLGCSPLLRELLSGRQTNENRPPQGAGPSQPPRGPRDSHLSHGLLSGRQVNDENSTQAPPPQALHRHNSSQAHDLLHGRQTENETSPAQTGPSQLRSSLLCPGQKGKGKEKRVSWQI